jgi:ribosomal-protein-alanine N-acetyltransferase
VVSGPALVDVTAAYTLRRMAQRDLAAILEIERVSFPSPWSLAGFERELATAWAMPTVALEDGPGGERVVGYACAWYVADEVQLLNVAVHPERRRRGIGEALVRRVQADAATHGARAIVLEVRVANLPARRLYARLGFRTTGVRRGYYGLGQDGMLMEWRLGG